MRVSYSKTEEVESADVLQHPLVREAMALLHMSGGIEITSVADIPSRGAGLGSSSSFTVGLERHENIRSALPEMREVKFRFQPQGSRIIFVH